MLRDRAVLAVGTAALVLGGCSSSKATAPAPPTGSVVLWVASGIRPDEVWEELKRREGISGIAEKASRARNLPVAFGLETTKIP